MGVRDSLQACQKDAQTRQPARVDADMRPNNRKISETVAVRSPGRGTEVCAVISVHASTLMCVSSNYLLALVPLPKITSPSRQLIKCRKI